VELGVHAGYSYLAFAEAIKRLKIPARCFGVDTWKGDEHAGFYGEDVFEELRRYHDQRYSEFSELIRSTFDNFVGQVRDGTIDLLHIDGRHLYDDVKHDFTTWKPKLSDRAIVLFHDTNEHENNFGVAQFWQELRQQYPHFEFMHGHGLGVLAIGTAQTESLSELFGHSRDPAVTSQIRELYSRLGVGLKDRFDLAKLQDEHKALRSELSRAGAECERLKTESRQNAILAQQLQGELLALRRASEEVKTELTQVLNGILSSTSWRVTSPIRAIGKKIPWLRDAVKRVLGNDSGRM
jgi:hypothetical protein